MAGHSKQNFTLWFVGKPVRLNLAHFMTDNAITFGVPVRVGDRLRTYQRITSVSELKTTKLGTGRFWGLEIVYENQNGEHVGTETYTGFGYKREA